MIPALVDGELRRATPGARGKCPECGDPVYARIPDHAIRHWAHTPLPDGTFRDCSRDVGEMSEWHREWQFRCIDLERIEVIRGDHRADAVNLAGIILEFQRSSIPPEDIKARERSWGRGIWILDGTGTHDDGSTRVTIRRLPDQSADDPYRSIQWPRAPLILYRARWPIWVDVGNSGLIQVRNFNDGRGNGWLVTRDWFIAEVLNGHLATLRTHTPPRTDNPRAAKRVGHARPETQDDLSLYPVNCIRVDEPEDDDPDGRAAALVAAITAVVPSIGGYCCGERYPGQVGAPLVPACQLCPKSVTYYWREVNHAVVQGG